MDSTTVYFSFMEKGIEVDSILANFTLFGQEFTIRWYGAIIAFGFLLAVLWGGRMAYKWKMNLDKMIDVLIAGTFGGILGARLYYVAFRWDYYADHLDEIFKIWNGGLAIYGGIIGALLTGFVMCKIRKVKVLAMFDIASLGFLIGQCIGRWGNFINQEAFGAAADPDYLFGMTGTIISTQVEPEALVHPCFIYESLWCLLGFVLLHFYSKKLRTYDGEMFLLYCVWYGLGRFFIEGLRTDSLYLGDTGIRVSQLVAAVAFFAGLILFITFKIITEKKKLPLWVNSEGWTAMQEEYKKEAESKAAKKAKKEGVAKSILADDADEVTLEEAEDEAESEADENEAEDTSDEDNNDNESEDK